jgi:hypothetical protein
MARKSPEKFEYNKDVHYPGDPNVWLNCEQVKPDNESGAVSSPARETSWF